MNRDEILTVDQWRRIPRGMAIEALLRTPALSDELSVEEIQTRASSPPAAPGERLAVWATLRHHAPSRFPGARDAMRRAIRTLGEAKAHTNLGTYRFTNWLVTHPDILAPQITRMECSKIMRSMEPIGRMAMLLEIWDTPMRNENRERVNAEDWRHSHWRGLLATDSTLRLALEGGNGRCSPTGLPHMVDLTLAHPDTLARLVGRDAVSRMLVPEVFNYTNRFGNAPERIDMLTRLRPVLAPRFGRDWESAITAKVLTQTISLPGPAGPDTERLGELLDAWRAMPEQPAITPDAWADIYEAASTGQRTVMMLHADTVFMLPADSPAGQISPDVRSPLQVR